MEGPLILRPRKRFYKYQLDGLDEDGMPPAIYSFWAEYLAKSEHVRVGPISSCPTLAPEFHSPRTDSIPKCLHAPV